jgi:ATP adenylyltransferase
MWAPWRMSYVSGDVASDVSPGCPFCVLPASGDDRAAYILYRGTSAYVIMNLHPYNSGHVMVIPYAHVDSLQALDDASSAELMHLARRTQGVLSDRLRPHGFNLGMNLGAAAGAGIAEHIHLHVVPRWNGDTNFMPVTNDTRVMPQHLDDTYDLLVEGFAT